MIAAAAARVMSAAIPAENAVVDRNRRREVSQPLEHAVLLELVVPLEGRPLGDLPESLQQNQLRDLVGRVSGNCDEEESHGLGGHGRLAQPVQDGSHGTCRVGAVGCFLQKVFHLARFVRVPVQITGILSLPEPMRQLLTLNAVQQNGEYPVRTVGVTFWLATARE